MRGETIYITKNVVDIDKVQTYMYVRVSHLKFPQFNVGISGNSPQYFAEPINKNIHWNITDLEFYFFLLYNIWNESVYHSSFKDIIMGIYLNVFNINKSWAHAEYLVNFWGTFILRKCLRDLKEIIYSSCSDEQLTRARRGFHGEKLRPITQIIFIFKDNNHALCQWVFKQN